ncbi:MAG: glycosyltransferase [Symploca sp. SIO2B6]|nr:glycosyltransferase [Symploca sp. SIO2B6]
MKPPPYILVLSSIDSVIASGYYSRLFHKLSLQLKTLGINVTVLSPQRIRGEGGKFNTQQLSWLRYCIDKTGGCDIHDEDLEYFHRSNHFFQNVWDIVSGSVQIFKQCWHQKPRVLQIHQPLYYGLMALPTSLILGIPMILSFGFKKNEYMPKSWIKKSILKILMRWAKVVIASSHQIKAELQDHLYDREVVVIPDEYLRCFNPAKSRFYSNHWQPFIPLKQVYSNHWQETITRWCQVFAETCKDGSWQVSHFSNRKECRNESDKSSTENYQNQIKNQMLHSMESSSLPPVLNIVYYKSRELRKLMS